MKIKSQAGHQASLRKLKIASKHFARRGVDAEFPEIRIAGKWLEDNGFVIGNRVTLQVERNRIIIVADPVVPDPEQEELKRKEEARNRLKMRPLEKYPFFHQPVAPLCKDTDPNPGMIYHHRRRPKS